MLLSDTDIVAAIETGRVQITPYDPAKVQPASIDLHLGNTFRLFSNDYALIDPTKHQPGLTEEYTRRPGDAFTLLAGEFVLAHTVETVTLGADIAARLEGKSSLGRLGLLTHVTAGWIDPGFHGQITLELANVSGRNIQLWPGMPIGQLCLFTLTSPATRPYGTPGLGSRYQGQAGPTPSRGVTVP